MRIRFVRHLFPIPPSFSVRIRIALIAAWFWAGRVYMIWTTPEKMSKLTHIMAFNAYESKTMLSDTYFSLVLYTTI